MIQTQQVQSRFWPILELSCEINTVLAAVMIIAGEKWEAATWMFCKLSFANKSVRTQESLTLLHTDNLSHSHACMCEWNMFRRRDRTGEIFSNSHQMFENKLHLSFSLRCSCQ